MKNTMMSSIINYKRRSVECMGFYSKAQQYVYRTKLYHHHHHHTSTSTSSSTCSNVNATRSAHRLITSKSSSSSSSSSSPSSSSSSSKTLKKSSSISSFLNQSILPKLFLYQNQNSKNIQTVTNLHSYSYSILSRLPIYIFLFVALQEDSISPLPFCIDHMVGPSMIPTIYTNEVYLRLRPVPNWINDLYQFIMKHTFAAAAAATTSSTTTSSKKQTLNYSWMKNYKVGDIVIIQDFKGMYACKRIVGIENDIIWKYGQYAIELYSKEDDFGIKDLGIPKSDSDSSTTIDGSQRRRRRSLPLLLPKWEDQVETIQVESPRLPSLSSSTTTKITTTQNSHRKLYTKIKIPKNHVWVEGDNPLESVDSRHYGPVPIENVRGRIIYRLWPRVRARDNVDDNVDACWISNQRPTPPKG